MVDILHKVGIKSSSQDDAYKALTTLDGLSGWWTNTTLGEGKIGGVLQFRFGAGGIDMLESAATPFPSLNRLSYT
jgi:hypothetical protein